MTRRHPSPLALLAVAAGGAVGAVLRWGLGEAFAETGGFPWTTFAINVTGSFALALLPALSGVRARPTLVLLLGPGLLGGFTTLSAYSEHVRSLGASGDVALAAAYLVGTLVACLLAVAIASRFTTAAQRREFADEEGDE